MGIFDKLEQNIGYSFNDEKLLITALTHSSYSAENGKSYRFNNERLEFIGDAYLDAIIGAKLYDILPDEHEGVLSKDRAAIVCEGSLASISREIGLGGFLFLGKGEDNCGGRNKDSILADAMEAVIGAMIIDGGFDIGRNVVLELFGKKIRLAIKGKLFHDYKSSLQEKLQEKHKGVSIEYAIVSESGPDHDKLFTVAVTVNGKKRGEGLGKSKKDAEQEAAKTVILKGEL